MASVLIVEDQLDEVVTHCVEIIARLLGDTSVEKWSVAVMLLGDPTESALGAWETSRVQLPVNTRLINEPIHAKNRPKFIEEVVNRARLAHLVLIDRTVKGAEWPDRLSYTDWVYEEVCRRLNRTPRLAGPSPLAAAGGSRPAIFRFSLNTRSEVDDPTDLQSIVLKYRKAEAQVEEFRVKVLPHLRPVADNMAWERNISSSTIGQQFRSFVDEIRRDPLDERLPDADKAAESALRSLLFREDPRGMSLRRCTQGSLYRDPDSRAPTFQSRFGDINQLRLVRRRVLLGLQKIWAARVGATFQASDPTYRLWLEVLACGFHTYHFECHAIAAFIEALKRGSLSRTRKGTLSRVALSSLDAEFRGRNDRIVKGMFIMEDDDGWGTDSEGRDRFFSGSIYFEDTPRTPRGPHYRYWLSASDGPPEPPSDGADALVWDRFWRKGKVNIDRQGDNEEVNSMLTRDLCFSSIDAMYSFASSPMPEEARWWERIAASVQSRAVSLDSRWWEPIALSEMRWEGGSATRRVTKRRRNPSSRRGH